MFARRFGTCGSRRSAGSSRRGRTLLGGPDFPWGALSDAIAERWLVAIAINLVLGALAYRAGGLDRTGSASGMLLGIVLYLSLGAAGYALLAAFYILGSGATRLGPVRERSRGLAQADSGRRSARNVIANAGVAVAWAVVALLTPFRDAAVPACAAALAAATGDTLASELGQLVGGRTRLITDLSPVEPGTEGGVSLWGSLAGLGGSVTIAALGGWLGLYAGAVVPAVALAGVLGIFADSLLGATLERRGLLDNEGVNFAATLAASLAVVWWV